MAATDSDHATADPPAVELRPDLTPLLLTQAEVAAMLRVSPHTIENLHRCGALRGVLVGRYRLWRPEAVRAFVEGLQGGGE